MVICLKRGADLHMAQLMPFPLTVSCFSKIQISFFTARYCASAVLAMALCPSVCPSVSPSQVRVLLKRLNIGLHKQHHTTLVQGLQFSEAKYLHEISLGSPPVGAPNAGGVGQNRRLSTNNRLSRQEAQLTPRDRAMRLVSSNLANCHATVQKLLIRQVLTKSMV